MSEHEASCIQRRLGSLPITLDTLNALAGPFNPEIVRQYSGVIIGGSGQFSVHHPDSHKWTDAIRNTLDVILKDKKPLFGICFGHQLLAYHLGVEICTSSTHSEVGTLSFNLTEAGNNDPIFSYLGKTFLSPTGHTDYVIDTPEEATLLAQNEQLLTQAFYYRELNAYATQFHPDLTGLEARDRYLACCVNSPLLTD
jgi:GMP synthase (glutamine-hydrolysing)